MQYVILAAGLGSRFVKEGEKNPKPLVDILGEPMIGRLIRILVNECNGEKIFIAANKNMPVLAEYLDTLKAQGLPLDVRNIVSDNSYYSLTEACKGVTGKFIAMTVDAIFPLKEFKEYAKAVEAMPEGEVLMGLTRFVDDESPLYARMGNGEVIDYRYGGEPFAEGTIVSAGLYGLNDAAMDTVAAREGYPESLSDFQRILAAETPIRVVPFEFSKALDVDCRHDRLVAEEFLQQVNGETRKN